MKKLFLLLALAGVMVACGDKKENKKDEAAKANTENVDENNKGEDAKADAENVEKNKKDEAAKADAENVKETNSVDALVKETVKAMQAEDYAALESIMVEYEKLSKEDQAKFDAAMEKEMMKMM